MMHVLKNHIGIVIAIARWVCIDSSHNYSLNRVKYGYI